ncbi:MAG: hypothetical protein Q7S70_01945, partial [bacterium]|nr:hypothetical protein [bacterium]
MRYKASIVIIISLAFLFLDVFFLSALSDNKGYSLSPLSSISQEKGSIQINLNFISPSAWHQNIPEYDVQEIFDLGETKIVFHNVDSAKTQFDYAELANNPLIDDLDYHQEGRDFVLEIRRKGAFLPSAVTQDGSFVIIRLKEGDVNYPVILAQKPADISAAYPAFRNIIFEA